MSKPTCGPLYKAGLDEFTEGAPALAKAFAAGFISGQAEKVYLGACRAAMFRPSPEHRANVIEIIRSVCERYELYFTLCDGEIWVTRIGAEAPPKLFVDLKENSAAWHQARARLCGVPEAEIDVVFHHRRGYGEKCDA